MELKIVSGNILNANERIIAHQTNAYGVMGAGLAKQIVKLYPSLRGQYSEFVQNKINKPTAYKPVDRYYVLGNNFYFTVPDSNKVVVNMVAQMGYGRDSRRYTDYSALYECLSKVSEKFGNEEFAVPYGLGCGLAGGDWEVVSKMLTNFNVVVYKLD